MNPFVVLEDPLLVLNEIEALSGVLKVRFAGALYLFTFDPPLSNFAQIVQRLETLAMATDGK